MQGFQIYKQFADVISGLSLAEGLREAAVRVVTVAVRQPLLLAVLGQVHDEEGHVLRTK